MEEWVSLRVAVSVFNIEYLECKLKIKLLVTLSVCVCLLRTHGLLYFSVKQFTTCVQKRRCKPSVWIRPKVEVCVYTSYKRNDLFTCILLPLTIKGPLHYRFSTTWLYELYSVVDSTSHLLIENSNTEISTEVMLLVWNSYQCICVKISYCGQIVSVHSHLSTPTPMVRPTHISMSHEIVWKWSYL